jgi:hypothetical protein
MEHRKFRDLLVPLEQRGARARATMHLSIKGPDVVDDVVAVGIEAIGPKIGMTG